MIISLMKWIRHFEALKCTFVVTNKLIGLVHWQMANLFFRLCNFKWMDCVRTNSPVFLSVIRILLRLLSHDARSQTFNSRFVARIQMSKKVSRNTMEINAHFLGGAIKRRVASNVILLNKMLLQLENIYREQFRVQKAKL